MKKIMWLAMVGLLIAAPSWLAAQEGGANYDHGSVGIFADYMRFSPGSRTTNFVGFGARAGFHTSQHVALEGEMNYDFERNSSAHRRFLEDHGDRLPLQGLRKHGLRSKLARKGEKCVKILMAVVAKRQEIGMSCDRRGG